MPPQKNSDEKVKVETYLPMTAFKQLLLWAWVKGQSRSEMVANTFAARAEFNEAQFMASLEKRARDKGMTLENLEQQIYEQAGLIFSINKIEDEFEDTNENY